LRVGVDDIKIDWLKLRFTLAYDQYSGEFEGEDAGLGGGNFSITANINKSILSVGLFPLNFNFSGLELNLGVEFSRLIREDFEGKIEGNIIGQGSFRSSLEERYDRYSERDYFGLRGRLAYELELSELWSISPQYAFYLGISDEFREFPEDSRSNRHFFGIGIQKSLE